MGNRRVSYPISQSPLYRLSSRRKLAGLLGISNSDLRGLSSGDALYREFDITKKDGGLRHVEHPGHKLKATQARLAKLLSRVSPPEYLFCPVKGRCYVDNARQHVDSRVIRCLDIKKYFPNTRARRVFWFFNSIMKCERDIAGLLTRLSTYQGHLPTGSPLSPILSYFAHQDVWQDVSAFCRQRGYVLTIYIDDCTISGNKVPMLDLWAVKRIIHRGGLRYHKEKTFVDVPAEVTGVILRDGRVTVPHRQFKKLKTATDNLTRMPIDASKDLRNRVAGLRGQIAQITKHRGF